MGGGARAAYQVGVLRAIAASLPGKTSTPFPIICGTSAGAINAVALAARASNFRAAVGRMLRIWSQLHVNHVYRAGLIDVLRSLWRWAGSVVFSRRSRFAPVSLLDNSPLRKLLERCIDFSGIQRAINDGALDALCVTASGYASGHSLSFFQGTEDLSSWQRARRVGCRTEIGLNHILASTAIPFVFTPVHLGSEYYGDGSMQQLAPFSPVLHLGADRVLAISVGRPARKYQQDQPNEGFPSLAQIAGHLLDCVFLDSLEMDLERLRRINQTIDLMPQEVRDKHGLSLRRVETLVLAPSQPIESIASRFADALPWPVRMLMRLLGGSGKGGSNLLSYLLFEQTYCRALIKLGYDDTMRRMQEVLQFLGHDQCLPEFESATVSTVLVEAA